MKRGAPWEQTYTISDSSDSNSDSDEDVLGSKKNTKKIKNGGSRSSKGIMSEEIMSRKKKQGGMNYEALNRHGYHGGPSILNVPPPRVDDNDKDWSWSKGKRDGKEDALEESYEERERTRAISKGEKLLTVQSSLPVEKKEKNASFSQKEKRKRDLGQASRGKNYVEEEKRLLRDSGIYSGFDS